MFFKCEKKKIKKIKYGCKKANERKAAYAKLYVKPAHKSNDQGRCW